MRAAVRARTERPAVSRAKVAGKATAASRKQADRKVAHLAPHPEERIALPHRTRLEERFARPLDSIAVYAGPRVAAGLEAMDAVSAARGEAIFLSDASPALPIVAHEVAHVLQARRSNPRSTAVEPDGSAAETEATRAAVDVSGRLTGARVTIGEGLGRDTIALLRMSPRTTEPSTRSTDARRVRPLRARVPADQPAVSAERDTAVSSRAEAGPVAASSSTAQPVAADRNSAPVVVDATPADQFAVPQAPAPDAAMLAAREDAAAAAEAAISAAATPAERLKAFGAAPPSVKARQAAALATGVAELAGAESRQWLAGTPGVTITLPGTGPAAPSTPAHVSLPPTSAPVDFVDTAVAPTPEPELGLFGRLSRFRPVVDATAPLDRALPPEPAALAERIDESIESVPTVDPDVPRSAGPVPTIPLVGDTDPHRVTRVEAAAVDRATQERRVAQQAVEQGPGPEQVQLQGIEIARGIGDVPIPAIAAPTAPEGPAQYAAMNLPPEVEASFDEQQRQTMAQSMSSAQLQAEDAAIARDKGKRDALDAAAAAEAALATEAQTERTDVVAGARREIGVARRDTIDAQQQEVDRVTQDAEAKRHTHEGTVQETVTAEQRKLDTAHADADRQIVANVNEGERKALAEKQRAQREAEDEGWFSRAVSFVKRAIESFVAAVTEIIDAVRTAVNGLLDVVKRAALAAIDAVAAVVKAAIAGFGEFLKAAVNGLLSRAFPELAARLNAAIDRAVAASQRAVDVVADKLRRGVEAVTEGLRRGLNAALDAFKGGIELALAIAKAAITGDWEEVLRRVIEGVLRLVGIDPAAFFGFVGRAEGTLRVIIDSPGTFLRNLLGAVTGGIDLFASRIGTHLETGVVGWLTGTLGPAGLIIPAKFDLFGVLDLLRQILGLTWDALKARARTVVGEKNLERLEGVFAYIGTLASAGWGKLWEQITADVAALRERVFGEITTFVQQSVIVAAITRLAMLFNPVGAIVQLVLTAWNLFTFLRDNLARLAELVKSVVGTITEIAHGVLDTAAMAVEGVLGRALPLAIDLLARTFGLRNVGSRVRDIIQGVRDPVEKAIDAVLARVAAAFKGSKRGKQAAPNHIAFAGKAGDLLEEEAKRTDDLPGLKVVAAGLEPSLSAQLEPGTGLRFLFTGGTADAEDGIVEVDVVIAPNTTRKHKELELKDERKGATGIGEVKAYGAHPPRNSAGVEWLRTEAEHVIPYAMASVLLEAAGASGGDRRKNRKFDAALATVLIYQSAADEKTSVDVGRITEFQEETEYALGQVHEERASFLDDDEATVKVLTAHGWFYSLLGEAATDTQRRTNIAVKNEHAKTLPGQMRSNGWLRGEPGPVPGPKKVKEATNREHIEIVKIAERLFSATANGSARSIKTVTLADLNEMSIGELGNVVSVGAKRAELIAANRPFTSVAHLKTKVPGLPEKFLNRVKR